MIKLNNLNKNNQNKLLMRIVNKEDFKLLNNKTSKKITTGIITIFDLLKFDISELYITGFNFYDISITKKRRTYYSGYYVKNFYCTGKVLGSHNLKKELLMFIKWYNEDKRIKCEEPLIKLMKKYSDNVRG